MPKDGPSDAPGRRRADPGGSTTGRFWDRLVPALTGRALAVDLPGRSGKPADPMTLTLDDCARSVVDDVCAWQGTAHAPVVVVAHSSGGLVAPAVVERLGADRVVGIVLSSASVPPDGGCGLDCMKQSHRTRTVEAVERARSEGRTLMTPGPPDDPEPLRTVYGGEPLDDDLLAYVVDPIRSVPDAFNVYFQPVSWAAVATVPVTYVRALHDRPVPGALQDEMIARLPNPVDVVTIEAGHLPPVTHPEWFADVVATVGRVAQD